MAKILRNSGFKVLAFEVFVFEVFVFEVFVFEVFVFEVFVFEVLGLRFRGLSFPNTHTGSVSWVPVGKVYHKKLVEDRECHISRGINLKSNSYPRYFK